MLRDLTVGKRLGAAFGCVVLMSIVASLIVFIGFRQVVDAAHWNIHSAEVLRTSDAVLTNMLNMETGVRGFVASGDEKFLDPYAQGKENIGKSLDALKALTADNASQQERMAALYSLYEKAHAVHEQLISMRRAVTAQTTPQDALTKYFGEAHDKEFMDAFRAKLAEFDKAESDLQVERSARVTTLEHFVAVIVFAAGLAIALVSSLLGVFITRSIVKALGGEPHAASEVTRRISTGDLSRPMSIATGDTTSVMAGLETMRSRLGETVAQIRSVAGSIATAAQEIASGNVDLSARTEKQASSLEQTAASMTQLTETVKRNADNAREANTLATRATDKADAGNVAVQEMVQTIVEISDRSTKISEITGTIEGIAFQTNILALNAAVEAARAGEQGRGFAVVASEVRSLAQRSAAAAKEIKDLIASSVTMIQGSAQQATDVGTTMGEVRQAIKQVSDIVGEIAAASVEQSRGIEQVHLAVAQMDEVTQQNAALVEQAAAAAQSLEAQTESLDRSVSVFKVSPQAGAAA
jgi:methyl-accepting chemotaxis protein